MQEQGYINEVRAELRRLHERRNQSCSVPERCKAAIEAQQLGHALTAALIELQGREGKS